ncbi:glycerophosphoryl diester phosphodiesterase [Lepidopterella palustris CBS 459.81]|uniref:glycerophosphodiester phosphodiesterase n=1 Tax=Lepidopterella palustris CBS 459.81 TaxID=1314670 RepID=A0A8E2E413_9PEZI|nr:glycerophosphoryl diester phosphodiesterase [Lepidopterella palustris CBS 459.81]
MMRAPLISSLTFGLASAAPFNWPGNPHHHDEINVQLGPRPYFVVNDMDEGPLKIKLQSCSEGPFYSTDFTFGHRGAPLQFPEHTKESYMAAARMGAGVIECDVTFTKDKQLVCRHSMCDLHTTTNILTIPELAKKCTQPFIPADPAKGTPASATCCTSDITLAEFKALCAKMDGSVPTATNVTQYMAGTPPFRTDLYSTCGTLMTHKEYIGLIDGFGLKFTPEAKTPMVPMPYEGWTQEQFAQSIIDDYKNVGIDASRVYPQSFLIDDVYYWIKHEPEFGKQAVALDEQVDTPEGYLNSTTQLATLAKNGVKIVAPAFFALVKLDTNMNIVPSEYSIAARKAGLDIISWSFERSGFLNHGGGYYYQYVKEVINNDGDMYTVLDVLAKQVGIRALFSDWPASVTYYANCMGL